MEGSILFKPPCTARGFGIVCREASTIRIFGLLKMFAWIATHLIITPAMRNFIIIIFHRTIFHLAIREMYFPFVRSVSIIKIFWGL